MGKYYIQVQNWVHLVLPFCYCYLQLRTPIDTESSSFYHGERKKKKHLPRLRFISCNIQDLISGFPEPLWVIWFPFFSFPSHCSHNSTSTTRQQKTSVQVKSCARRLYGISNLIKQELNPRITLQVNPVPKIFSLEEASLGKGRKNQVSICTRAVKSARDKHLQIIMLSF